MRDALLDLLLGSTCAVCARPGRVLCPRCLVGLPRTPFECRPSPPPPGLARPTAVGEYAGALRALVNAHKEDRRFALAAPLGELLAAAVLGHPGTGPLALVPVPSRGPVVRRRGHDPLLRVTQHAAGRLRGRGTGAVVARMLRSARATLDQAGLGAEDRAANLVGSMVCRRRPPGGLADGTRILVVDDVITTGSTLREAQRALEDAGFRVHGVAVVAATRRTVRRGPEPPGYGPVRT